MQKINTKKALVTATLAACALLANTAGAQELSTLSTPATWNLDGITTVVAAILVGVGVPVTIGFTSYRLGKKGANKV